MKVRHSFISGKPEGKDPGKVRTTNWNAFHTDENGNIIESIVLMPPTGKCRVINIYIDPETDKTIIKYDSNPI